MKNNGVAAFLVFPFLGFLVLGILARSPGLAASDWPRFRGPHGTGVSEDQGLPLTWSATENIVWKVALAGRGSSSPITLGDRIFVTAFSDYGLDARNAGERKELRQHVICLDRKSGRVLWDKSTLAGAREQDVTPRIADHGYSSSTPVCDESGVYAFFGTSGVIAYDLQGKLKWRATRVGDTTVGFGTAASPIIHKNLLIVNASIESKTVFAFDKNSGKEIWKAGGIERSWTTPKIVEVPGGKPELVVSQKFFIYGFDPDTGKKLWTCSGIQDYVVPCAVDHEGIVYCIGGRQNMAIAVRAGGRGDVSDSHKLWEVKVGANVTSPVYLDGHLYWASDKGIACCLNAETGETVYRERLPTRARIYASVVLAAGRLYVTTRDSGVLVLKAVPTYETLARNVIEGDDGMVNATPAISNGQLLLRTDRFLYCIGTKKTGKVSAR